MSDVAAKHSDQLAVALDLVYRARLQLRSSQVSQTLAIEEGAQSLVERVLAACLVPLLAHQDGRLELEMRHDAQLVTASINGSLDKVVETLAMISDSLFRPKTWRASCRVLLHAADEYSGALRPWIQFEWYNAGAFLARWEEDEELGTFGLFGASDDVQSALIRRGFRDVDDLRRTKPSEYDEFVREADPDGSRRRTVLLGAGASVNAGLPTAVGLDETFRSLDCPVYRTLSDMLKRALEPSVQMLQLIAGDGNDSLGIEFGRAGGWQPVARAAGVQKVSSQAQKELTQILDWIRSHYWLDSSHEDSVGKCKYLGPLIQAQVGSSIVTLNYDNTLDCAGYVSTCRGLADEDVWPIELHPMRTRVLPLHGSIGWEERQDPHQGLVRIALAGEGQSPADLNYPYRPGIIFGAGNKLRWFGPYQELLTEFSNELLHSQTLITIGYSWQDPHVNTLIRRWVVAGARDPFEDYPAERARRRLVVGTGPDTGALPEFVEVLRVHYGDSVSVRAVRGEAPDVIKQLFTEGPYSLPHIESYREFVCSL